MTNAICLVEPDPFLSVANFVKDFVPKYGSESKAVGTKRTHDNFNMADIQTVSRPLNGIVAKPDTHAYIQVIDAHQNVIKVFNQLGIPAGVGQSGEYMGETYKESDMYEADAGEKKLWPRAGGGKSKAGKAPGIFPGQNGKQGLSGSRGAGMDDKGNPAAAAWTDWILQSVREVRVEKTQLVETFGDSYLYAFGEKPRVLGISGILMNTADYNWRMVFWENWDRFFRATKLIQRNARMYIGWDDILVEGYPIQAMAQESSDSPNAMSFSFQFYVTNYFNMSMANRATMLAAGKMHRISTTRSMWADEPVKQAVLGSKTWSVFDMVLGKGAASKVWGAFKPNHYNSASGKWEVWDQSKGEYVTAGQPVGFDDKGKFDPNSLSDPFAKLAIRLAKQAADMLTKAPFKLATGRSANMLAFTNANLIRGLHDVFATAADVVTSGAESLMGAKAGEVNAWFGYVGTIVDTALSIHKGRWAGVPDDFSGAMGDALRAGSLDRLVQRLAYQSVSAMGIPTGRYRDATTLSTITHGSNMKFGAYPGAAVVLNMSDMNPSSSMDLDFGTAEASSGNLEAGDEVAEWFNETF